MQNHDLPPDGPRESALPASPVLMPDGDLLLNPMDGFDEPVTVHPVAVVTEAEASALLLTKPQQMAIIELTSGATRAAAALAAGVTRTTLYRWLNHDAAFQAAFNAWQKDVISTAQAQLLAASHEAVACVVNAIRKGDAHLAWKMLQSQGMSKTSKPGSTDVAQLQLQEKLDAKRAKIQMNKEIDEMEMDNIKYKPDWSPL